MLSEHGDAEDKAHQPPSGEENSPDEDAHIIPERHLEQENLCIRLIATARSLKKQKQRLKAAQNTLNRRWNKVLDNKEKYGGSYHTKSYPKRKLLPEFDDEAVESTQPKNKTANRPDQLPCGRDRVANKAAHKSAHDSREDLHQKTGATRSIYKSRKRAPAHNQNQTLQLSERHDTSKYRGAAHPLCVSPTRCWTTNFQKDSNP